MRRRPDPDAVTGKRRPGHGDGNECQDGYLKPFAPNLKAIELALLSRDFPSLSQEGPPFTDFHLLFRAAQHVTQTKRFDPFCNPLSEKSG